MFLFAMEECVLHSGSMQVRLLALVPKETIVLSNLIAAIECYPFSDVPSDDEFLDITQSEIQELWKYFPELERALMLFDGITVVFPLLPGREIT
jgi:hypothetical protein